MSATRHRGPCLGPHRYHPRDVIGRWTVIRHASPVERWRVDKTIRVHRVHVRCACGHERDIEEHELYRGKSSGCPSRTCIRIEALRSLVREQVTRYERAVLEVESAAACARDLEARLADVIARSRHMRAGLGGERVQDLEGRSLASRGSPSTGRGQANGK